MPRIIAFYLPQYHPTPDNDKWWGKGFTEWTNVGKAKPLFRGHYQPKVPADLGYYDLRIPEVREEQAKYAKEAGIEGFCYYHYWFGNGKQELEMPFKEVVRTQKPDFPFCLCWANESWHSKFWNNEGSVYSKKLLIEQRYFGQKDNIEHFFSLLPAFKDSRYMTYNGKLIFMIYKPFDFPKVSDFMSDWRKLAKDNKISGFHFIAHIDSEQDIEKAKSLGFDAVNIVRLWHPFVKRSMFVRMKQKVMKVLFGIPKMLSYKDSYRHFIGDESLREDVYPTIIPNWDHSPRSGKNGYVLNGCTPELFGKHLDDVFQQGVHKPDNVNIVFLKSWNEWGEGNYMEPDLKWGKQYIEMLNKKLIDFKY